jgi:hypothetical protein
LRFLTATVSVDAPAGEKRGDFLPILHGFFRLQPRLVCWDLLRPVLQLYGPPNACLTKPPEEMRPRRREARAVSFPSL